MASPAGTDRPRLTVPYRANSVVPNTGTLGGTISGRFVSPSAAQAAAINLKTVHHGVMVRRETVVRGSTPVCGAYQTSRPRISRRSQTFASRQSRITVSGETFNTAAVSSTLSPPKNRISMTRLFRSSNVASAFSASSSATKS